MGLSYPPNVVWNVWALAAAGRADAVLEELRQRWVPLRSVKENNTLSEHWQVEPDSRSQWSHAPMAAVLSFPMVFAGVRPTSAGWKSAEIRPQLAGLSQLQLETQTPMGPITFEATGVAGERAVTLAVPPGITADLLVAKQEALNLQRLAPGRFRLPVGEPVKITLRHG